MDARWWRLSQLDSAIVSSADGTGASWYKRHPEHFRNMMARSIKLHQQLLQDWEKLSEEYSRSLPEFTSQQAWRETFDAVTTTTPQEKARRVTTASDFNETALRPSGRGGRTRRRV